MIRNLTFALFFAYFTTGCSRIEYPATYTDETGSYRHVRGNIYYKNGDRISAKSYREYRLIWDKGFKTDKRNQVAGK
jgi:hypothetical protein